MNRKIFITDFDLKRFKWLISNSNKFDPKYIKGLNKLDDMLKHVVIVSPQEIPADVITMNSTFKIRNNSTNEYLIYTIVFPFDSDTAQNKISITDELGIALIGSKKGSIIEVNQNNDIIKYHIEEILYQPEANGNYYI